MSGYHARGEAMTGGVGKENDSTRGHAPARFVHGIFSTFKFRDSRNWA
jgi:hypothetical protein